jgi:hypothetical protein
MNRKDTKNESRVNDGRIPILIAPSCLCVSPFVAGQSIPYQRMNAVLTK